MDAQQEHDHLMATTDEKRKKSLTGSRKRVEDLLNEKKKKSAPSNDPISNAMANHPGLTLERALRIAEEYGF